LDDGRKYYYHREIATTQWEVPPGWIENTVLSTNSETLGEGEAASTVGEWDVLADDDAWSA
jgi:hypothetical protein